MTVCEQPHASSIDVSGSPGDGMLQDDVHVPAIAIHYTLRPGRRAHQLMVSAANGHQIHHHAIFYTKLGRHGAVCEVLTWSSF